MDKHERPYVCTAKGCEKIQGFTYSGGLLRHEREVHGKHGGPKKKLLCPHENCKRSSGKGFSRQENLSEHLRRVHTSAGPIQMESPGDNNTDDTASDVASAAFTAMAHVAMSPANQQDDQSSEAGGNNNKRKRDDDDDVDNLDYDQLRAAFKRLRRAYSEVKQKLEERDRQLEERDQQLEERTRSSSEMQAQLAAIQHALGNPINQTLAFQQAPEL